MEILPKDVYLGNWIGKPKAIQPRCTLILQIGALVQDSVLSFNL